MLLLRKLVESTAVNAACVLPLEDGLSVVLASIAECVHVYDVCPADAASAAASSSTSAAAAGYELRPRGHVFDVGCGVVSLLTLANQCVLLWTRDQECIIVRYQANLTSALVDPHAADSDHMYHPSGEPSPVHYKEHHWYVVHRLRLWCPDTCEPVHPPEMGVNDTVEVAYLRFCKGHLFLLSIKWDPSCQPGGAEAIATTSLAVPSLRTTRWHTGDYMRFYAGTRFHYPTQSCSVATRRPGESAAAHQRRIEQLWQSGSVFANVPDEDLIATHAVMELSKRKTAPPQSSSGSGDGGAGTASTETADWTGVLSVTVRRELYSDYSSLMPSPVVYGNTPQGGFMNVRCVAGQPVVHHTRLDFTVSRTTGLRDDDAAERKSAVVVAAPRRAGRRGLDWTQLVFLTSSTHTAVYHLQRPRTPLGTSYFALDGLFAGPLQVRQVLFCTHSGDASNDVWVALEDGAVARFAVAELRARESAAHQVRNAHYYPWPVTAINGLPRTFVCRRLLPADNVLVHGRGVDALIPHAGNHHSKGGIGHGSSSSNSAGGGAGLKNALLSVYPCARRYALLSDSVQDIYVVDLVERRVVAALAGDGPMTDVCEAPHGYVAAFARGVLRYFQPGMQLYVRGTVRLPPFGVPIHLMRGTRVLHGAGVEAGVYVMVSSSFTSQLYHIADGNMRACSTEAWAYERGEATLEFEAVREGGSTVLVQCTATRCVFATTVHDLPEPVCCAVVAVVPAVGPVCIGAFAAGPLACTHLAVTTAAAGACVVDVTTGIEATLGLPSNLTARGFTTSTSIASVEVLVGRWDGCVTVSELQKGGGVAGAWRCVASQVIRVPFGTAPAVQHFLPLPRAGHMSRWMAGHSSGEVSILALTRTSSHDSSEEAQQKQKKNNNGGSSETSGWTFAWASTSPPYRRAQQKLTSGLTPIVRAPPHDVTKVCIATGTAAAEKEEDEEAELYNGFDGALMQPRDGAFLLFSVPLEEGDTQAPPHMQRLRERDEEDREWVVRLENTLRAIVPSSVVSSVRESPWRCALLVESVNAAGELRYDAIVAQHDEVTLCTLDSHLCTAAYPRPRTTSPSAIPQPRRTHVLSCTSPSRYICTRRLQLPQLNPHETLVSIAREPDDEGEGVLLCVTVCEQTALTRLTTLHSGTLAVLEALVLRDSIAHWMYAVPPSTPTIARAAPLFLLCAESTRDGTVELLVVAGHPLRIASRETLEDSPGWMDVASRGVKVDGAVQVVPTHINREGDTYGGEVLVTVAVDYAIHLFVLRGYTLLFQHCVLAPACTTSVTLCYPIVSVCTEGDSNVYLQVYPVDDNTEVLAPSYASEATQLLPKYGKVSWKMRVAMREPSLGACVLAQVPLYDRFVRTDVEGDVTVMFVTLSSASSRTRTVAAHVRGEDQYVGSADGPQTFLTHTVRLPAVPVKARVLRHVSPIQRRYARQLHINGHNYHLQSSSVRRDRSSRLMMLPCHDGSLYGAFEIPYGFAHPLMRLEQVITDAYALDLSVDLNPAAPGRLQYTYHLQPFHVAHALQPLAGMHQVEKQACVVVDAVFEYYLLRELMNTRYGASPAAVGGAAVDSSEREAAVVRRKFTALDDVVQTLLTEEYGEECTVDSCAEMLNVL